MNATCSTDGTDAEITFNDQEEIRLKQKHYITTDDFTEIHENFIHGMRKYLIMGDDTEPGGTQAMDCADGFSEVFTIIAAHPDYTLDLPSY